MFSLGVFAFANAAFSLADAAAAEAKDPDGLTGVVIDELLWLLLDMTLPLNIDFKDEDNIDLGVDVADTDDKMPDGMMPLLNLGIKGLRNGDLGGSFNSRPWIIMKNVVEILVFRVNFKRFSNDHV